MELTTCTVRYGRTHTLGNYSNVKPEVELTATLAPHDVLEDVHQDLVATARALVEDVIDEALEQQGDPALFSREPRYHVIKSRSIPPVLAIVPADAAKHAGFTTLSQGVRLRHATRIVQRRLAEHDTTVFIDCRDGDLSPLTESDVTGNDEVEVPF